MTDENAQEEMRGNKEVGFFKNLSENIKTDIELLGS
jgi:hypothetical protein